MNLAGSRLDEFEAVSREGTLQLTGRERAFFEASLDRRSAEQAESAARFESQRFTDFPTIVDAIKSGRLQATFMIVPLAMKLRAQGVPVKICYLGHRDGSTVMVRKDLPATDLRDLRGKTFAIPSKYSNQYLVITKLMQDQGVEPKEIRFVELPPPDMPGALASKAIDAYFVGEPFAAKAEHGDSVAVVEELLDAFQRRRIGDVGTEEDEFFLFAAVSMSAVVDLLVVRPNGSRHRCSARARPS